MNKRGGLPEDLVAKHCIEFSKTSNDLGQAASSAYHRFDTVDTCYPGTTQQLPSAFSASDVHGQATIVPSSFANASVTASQNTPDLAITATAGWACVSPVTREG